MRGFVIVILVLGLCCICGAEYRRDFMETYGCKTWQFFTDSEYKDAAVAILFQAAYESNWGRAHWVEKRNQVFALKDADALKAETGQRWEAIRAFDTFDDALAAQLNYYRKKKYPRSFAGFVAALEHHCYAQKPDYSAVVARDSGSMLKYVKKHCNCEGR